MWKLLQKAVLACVVVAGGAALVNHEAKAQSFGFYYGGPGYAGGYSGYSGYSAYYYGAPRVYAPRPYYRPSYHFHYQVPSYGYYYSAPSHHHHHHCW